MKLPPSECVPANLSTPATTVSALLVFIASSRLSSSRLSSTSILRTVSEHAFISASADSTASLSSIVTVRGVLERMPE